MAGVTAGSLMLQKRLLRTQLRQELRSISPALRVEEDVAIQNHVIASNWFKKSNRICAYISCAKLCEVDTRIILAECLKETEVQKKLYVPRIEDKKGHMRMLQIDSMTDLVANSMNILEPTLSTATGQLRNDVMEACEPIDLILLPGLAFDHGGNRLGRGGGYYDVFLKNYLLRAKQKGWEQPLLVALAYSIQIRSEPIPVTDNDRSIDAIVSSFGSLPITPFASEKMSSDAWEGT